MMCWFLTYRYEQSKVHDHVHHVYCTIVGLEAVFYLLNTFTHPKVIPLKNKHDFISRLLFTEYVYAP